MILNMRWPKICRRRPVLTNIAILTGSAFLERLLGGFYRVALARASGPEALGLLQYCLPFLRLGGILGTLGIPQALTREVAEALARGRRDEAEAMTAWALRAVGLAGAGLALALSLLPPVFRSLFPDPRVLPLFRWLGPVVVFSSLGMVLQGGLQGQNRMWPLALAGFVAQLGKLGLGLFLIGRVAPRGPSPIASAALAAMAASEFVSALAGRPRGRNGGGGGLLRSSLPLMGDGLLFALANAADMVIIPARLLRAGYAPEAITPLLGRAWGMALPTIFFPMVLVWPIAAATMPVVSAAAARGDRAALGRRICRGYLAVSGIASLSAAAFHLLAGPIVAVLYAAPAAAPFLADFAWAAPPIYLASFGADLLVALGRSQALFWQSALSVAARTGLVYLLTGRPRLGPAGAVLGIGFGNALLAATCAWTVRKTLIGLGNDRGRP